MRRHSTRPSMPGEPSTFVATRARLLSCSRRRPVVRSGAELAHAGRPILKRDGTISIDRGAIEERLVSTEAGVEQSWRLATAPSGAGDLVFHVRAQALAQARVRYGAATFVDAVGTRTDIAARITNEEIVLVVPDAVVRAAKYPAVLDPIISPEKEIDAPVAGTSAATGDQSSASIVAIGKNKGYLAIWYDRRGIRPGIYGARIDSAGNVLDATGIPIATGVGYTIPSIAVGDSGFLVTWAISYVDPYQQPRCLRRAARCERGRARSCAAGPRAGISRTSSRRAPRSAPANGSSRGRPTARRRRTTSWASVSPPRVCRSIRRPSRLRTRRTPSSTNRSCSTGRASSSGIEPRKASRHGSSTRTANRRQGPSPS